MATFYRYNEEKGKEVDPLVILTPEEGYLENLLVCRNSDELVMKMPCSILLIKKEPRSVSDDPADSLVINPFLMTGLAKTHDEGR